MRSLHYELHFGIFPGDFGDEIQRDAQLLPVPVAAALRRQRKRLHGPEKQGGIQRRNHRTVGTLLAENARGISQRVDIEVAPVLQGIPAEKVQAVRVVGLQLGEFRMPRAVHQPVMQVFLVRHLLKRGEVLAQERRIKRHAPGIHQYVHRYPRRIGKPPKELALAKQFIVVRIFRRQRIRVDTGLHVPRLVGRLDILGTNQIREHDRKGDEHYKNAETDFLENRHGSPPSRRYFTRRMSPNSLTVRIETESW